MASVARVAACAGVVACLLVASSGGAASGAAASAGSDLAPPARASFAGLQRRLAGQGQISIAVRPLGVGPATILGADPAMIAMSTSKVLILAALLRDKGGVSRFTSSELALAHAAITESDNQSILDLFSVLEQDRGGLIGASRYATRLLRDAGDRHTSVATGPVPAGYATTFGQTPWRPSAQIRFFRYLALGCLLPPRSTAYVLGLMRRIEPSESWGLGSAGFRSVAFKGGWGPLGNQYGVRQLGVVGIGRTKAVVAITVDPGATFAVGTSVITQVAQWLRAHLLHPRRANPACAAARRSTIPRDGQAHTDRARVSGGHAVLLLGRPGERGRSRRTGPELELLARAIAAAM